MQFQQNVKDKVRLYAMKLLYYVRWRCLHPLVGRRISDYGPALARTREKRPGGDFDSGTVLPIGEKNVR